MECTLCHNPLVEDAAYCPRCGERQADVPECDSYDYAAFISYRHRAPDDAVASRLHKAIEAYRLPKPVATRYGSPTLGRAFRDQDELPATGSLPDAIREALRRSRALVVVCSASTPESRWVAQEIELFASFHGRDRVFAVLAEGSSAESMPAALRELTRISSSGTPETVPAEPLAADMRPAASGRFNEEKLRVIAAIANCGYDELRQRERTRKRKMAAAVIAIATAATLALGAVIGSFATQADMQHQAALIEESQRLAAQSQQLLAEGDRYGAVEAALVALPASSTDQSRPLVPEAQEALEQALQVQPDTTTPWRASYSIEAEHALETIDLTGITTPLDSDNSGYSRIAVSSTGGFFAIDDTTGELNTYDLMTGKHLATCEIPFEAMPDKKYTYYRNITATHDKLVVADPLRNAMACLDPFTGECLWSTDELTALTATADGDYLDGMTTTAENEFSAGSLDLATGEVVTGVTSSGAEFPDLGKHVKCTMAPSAAEFCFGTGNRIALAEVDTGDYRQATLALPELTSLEYCQGMILACSVDENDGAIRGLHFAVEAFDSNLDKLWEYRGTFSLESIAGSDVESTFFGSPETHGATELDRACAVLSVGRNVYALDLKTGEPVHSWRYPGTVLDALPMHPGMEDTELLYVACADGSIMLENPKATQDDMTGDWFRMKLAKPIRWSEIAMPGDTFLWLSASAASDRTLVAYRVNMNALKETEREFTLDELIEQGHALLEEREG